MTPTKEYDGNGWSRYQKLILFRLDEQDKKLNHIDEKMEQLQNFKMKVVGWSSAASFLGAGAVAYFWR